MLRAKFVVIAAAVLAGGMLHAQAKTKKLGAAIVEYRDSAIQCVIAYEYSHRYHDGPWLLLDVGLQTKDPLRFSRDDFVLVTPDERKMRVATVARFIESAGQIKRLRQNASTSQSVTPYFIDRESATFTFLSLPGEGVVSDDLVTNQYGPSYVSLYFESMDGWREGSYRLVIDNGHARAELPVELK